MERPGAHVPVPGEVDVRDATGGVVGAGTPDAADQLEPTGAHHVQDAVAHRHPGSQDVASARQAAAGQLQEMIETHSAALFRAAFHMTGRADDAQDLVQETFIRAWRFIDTFDPARGARGWLFKILMNVHADYRRRQRRGPQVADLVEPDAADALYLYTQVAHSEELRARGDPGEVFFASLLGGEVRAALRAVPDQYRKVFLLSVEGFTYHEIAETLGIPMGTVMSRLHRARALLQQSLWDYCVQTGRCRPGVAPAPLPAPCADACRHLSGFLDRELTPDALVLVEGHLATCRQCCTRLEFQRRLEATIRAELRGRRLPRRFKTRLAHLVSLL